MNNEKVSKMICECLKELNVNECATLSRVLLGVCVYNEWLDDEPEKHRAAFSVQLKSLVCQFINEGGKNNED